MTQGQATWSLNNRLTITFLTFWFSVSRHPFSGWKIWSSEILSGFYLDLIRWSEPELVSQSDCKNQELESIIKHAFIALPAMVPLSRCCIWPIFCSMTDAFCSSEKLKNVDFTNNHQNNRPRKWKWPVYKMTLSDLYLKYCFQISAILGIDNDHFDINQFGNGQFCPW